MTTQQERDELRRLAEAMKDHAAKAHPLHAWAEPMFSYRRATEPDRILALLDHLDAQDRLLERARLEQDRYRLQYERAVQKLTSIYSLLYPANVTLPDGRQFAFKPKDLDPHALMQELSDRIRSIPDEVQTYEAATEHLKGTK